MAGYWLGPVTPEEVKPRFFYEEKVIGYEAFTERMAALNEINFENDQILVMFIGESKKPFVDDGAFHSTHGWDPDCQLLQDAVDFLKVRLQPKGWLLRVGVGSMDEWKDPHNPFRKDPRIRLSKLPTFLAWNTMKKVTGLQALQIQNIIVMLDD